MKVLVINSGSSSLKYRVYEMPAETLIAKGVVERIGLDGSKLTQEASGTKTSIEKDAANHGEALEMVIGHLTSGSSSVITSLDEIGAVGHRAVHGGTEISGSVLIDDNVIEVIERFAEMAPLHNPANLKGMVACRQKMPGISNVAVFDTAFHQTMPDYAYMYALPYRYYEEYKIRRYGFHGTSHRYVSMRAAELLERPYRHVEMVTCHLGNGSSICAVRNGRSIDTSMGFSPVCGIPMGTRAGDIDPAIITYLQARLKLDRDELDELLNKESGLKGLSGFSDMRDVEEHALQRERLPVLAMRMLAYSTRKYIGAYTAAMGHLDAVIFTAGIGENDPLLRSMVLHDLEFFGIEMDELRNDQTVRGIEGEISAETSRVKVYVIPTNEELMIARDTYEIVTAET